MQSIKIGYARTSTKEQELNRQLDWLKEQGVSEHNVFSDQLTGKSFKRPSYQEMKKTIKRFQLEGYKVELFILEVDRLGRNKELTLKELRAFKKDSVTMRLGNIPTTMTTQANDTMVDMVQNIMIEIYTTMAQIEIEQKAERQTSAYKSYGKDESGKQLGRDGKVVGRKKVELTKEQELSIKAWLDKENKSYKLDDCIKATGLGRATLYRIKKENRI